MAREQDDDRAAAERSHYTPDMTPAAVRERIVQLGFGGDEGRFEAFLDRLREKTPPEAEVILRGSAVTGWRWSDGQPFDADGPGTSDLDVTFVGGELVKLWNEYHIPGVHTVPFGEDHPDACPPLEPLRRELCLLARRPVNLQATTGLVQYIRDVIMEQPYVVLIERRDGSEEEEEEEDGAASDGAKR